MLTLELVIPWMANKTTLSRDFTTSIFIVNTLYTHISNRVRKPFVIIIYNTVLGLSYAG